MPTTVFTLIKTPTIQNILRKYKDGNYTKEALLYQDILRYSVGELEPTEKNILSFKLWELTEWLTTHNLEMAADYKNPSTSHMGKTNKIHARIGRVKRHLDGLLYLGLIGEIGQARETKGEGSVTVYSYTEFGLLIALIVMTFSAEKKDKANRYIYKFFVHNLEKNPSSVDTFSLLLINKLQKDNLFEKYIDTLLETLGSRLAISDLNEFFDNSMSIGLNKEESTKFMKLRREAFEELTPDMKRYLMHKWKMEIERKMFGISTDLKGFEKLAFELRNDYESIAAEGYCLKCRHSFHIQISLLEYLNRADIVNYMIATCPRCNERSILINSFYV